MPNRNGAKFIARNKTSSEDTEEYFDELTSLLFLLIPKWQDNGYDESFQIRYKDDHSCNFFKGRVVNIIAALIALGNS